MVCHHFICQNTIFILAYQRPNFFAPKLSENRKNGLDQKTFRNNTGLYTFHTDYGGTKNLTCCVQYMSEQRVTHRNRRRLVRLRMFECPQKKKDKRNSNNPIILESAEMALRSSKGSCPKSHKWLERWFIWEFIELLNYIFMATSDFRTSHYFCPIIFQCSQFWDILTLILTNIRELRGKYLAQIMKLFPLIFGNFSAFPYKSFLISLFIETFPLYL